MMFSPDFDPLEKLEQLETGFQVHHNDINQMKHNIVQLARAYNEQSEFVKQLVNQIVSQTEICHKLQAEVIVLEQRLKEIEDHGW